jgi:hypothetical protein
MSSIFKTADNDEFIKRIDKLTPSTPALWGKMHVSQMLAHCQAPLHLALGDLKLKRTFVGFLFGKMAKKKLLNDAPLKKNLPTFKEAVIKGRRNFDDEKKFLKLLIKRMKMTGPAGLAEDPHPFFGKLSPREWDRLNTKHLDHHLRQFGV